MERFVCDDTEWINGKRSERGIERHSMAGSKIRVERQSNGEVKVENDREADRKQM